jgi:hypothetical protein
MLIGKFWFKIELWLLKEGKGIIHKTFTEIHVSLLKAYIEVIFEAKTSMI